MIQNLIFGILFQKIQFRVYSIFILVHTFQWNTSKFFVNFQISEKYPSQKNQQKRSVILQYSFPQKTLLITRTSTQLTLKLKCSGNTAKNRSDFANIPAQILLFGARKNISTAPFLDAQEPAFSKHFIANVFIFLYISVRKVLFQRRSKVLPDE